MSTSQDDLAGEIATRIQIKLYPNDTSKVFTFTEGIKLLQSASDIPDTSAFAGALLEHLNLASLDQQNGLIALIQHYLADNAWWTRTPDDNSSRWPQYCSPVTTLVWLFWIAYH